MNRKLKKFMRTEFKSSAHVLDKKRVEAIAPDGEKFQIISQIGIYDSEETQRYYLHLIEYIFDKHFSEDKETMTYNIWREMTLNGVPFLGMCSGNRQGERARIGSRIRQLREAKNMEARDLAQLAGIDAANLSRIEQGKYSVGLDILSRIAFALGAHIDLVPNQI